MIPKEKAKQLLDSYSKLTITSHKSNKVFIPSRHFAKQSAIIAVDEALNEHNSYYGTVGENLARIKYNYWQQVRNELEAM